VASNNDMSGKRLRMKLQEQRKIYQDCSRSLSIDHPNELNFPITGMDLEFWENITSLGEDTEEIKNNTNLAQFN
jgi:hypothetical protein